jgi:hypothetical protein
MFPPELMVTVSPVLTASMVMSEASGAGATDQSDMPLVTTTDSCW